MPEPFRLAVQKALTAALSEITIENGYSTDLGGNVFRGRLIYGATDPLPMVSILEEPIAEETDLAPSGGADRSAYRLMVQGFVDDDPINPTDPAHWLLADVKKRLIALKNTGREGGGIFHFGAKAPMVDAVDFDGGVVRPPDGEVSAKAYFWCRVTLELVEDHENPLV